MVVPLPTVTLIDMHKLAVIIIIIKEATEGGALTYPVEESKYQ